MRITVSILLAFLLGCSGSSGGPSSESDAGPRPTPVDWDSAAPPTPTYDAGMPPPPVTDANLCGWVSTASSVPGSACRVIGVSGACNSTVCLAGEPYLYECEPGAIPADAGACALIDAGSASATGADSLCCASLACVRNVDADGVCSQQNGSLPHGWSCPAGMTPATGCMGLGGGGSTSCCP